jgi:hypothetical protein
VLLMLRFLRAPSFERPAVFRVRWLGTRNYERLQRLSRRKFMIICDLCGEAKNCLQKEIEGKEYDICSECWNPFAQRLMGKGRMKNQDTVFLPPPRTFKERENEEEEPLPGGPPKIWGAVDRPH